MKETGHYHGLYIGDPEIDFVKLADSQGVKGEKVTVARRVHGSPHNKAQWRDRQSCRPSTVFAG
jgi:hypothetical protein